MNYSFRIYPVAALLALASFGVGHALAQGPARPAAARPAAARAAVPATAPAAGAGWLTANAAFRKLAPGVMQDVNRPLRPEESIERHDVIELLYIDPNFDFAKDIPFRRSVWMLDIKYKPMRMIWADIPGPNARMLRKQIWYIVYQVTNPGQWYEPVEKDDPLNKLEAAGGVAGRLYKLEQHDKPVRFSPVFTLETHNTLTKEVPGFAKAAVEQYIPLALPAISAREDKNREFLTSEQMAQREIKPGETLWGVATWQDVDPNTVWFSVYLEGLTNTYKWTDDPAKYAAFRSGTSKTPYREISTKVLKLNFWRPGDEFTVKETQVRVGVPELPDGPPARPACEWVWWRTFPQSEKPVPPAGK